MIKAGWVGTAGVVLALGTSGCMFDNSQHIERERQRAEREAHAAQMEEDVRRLMEEHRDLERALNQERDARELLRQQVAAMEQERLKPAPAPVPEMPAMHAAPAAVAMTPEAEAVARVQEALKRAGYDPGPADGKMGQKTKNALMKFQMDNGLKADGVLGPQTLAKMKKYLGESDAVAP